MPVAGDRLSVSVDGLAAGVKAALAADTVRTTWRVALRALGERRCTDLVLRAALVGSRVGLFLLWDGHSDEED